MNYITLNVRGTIFKVEHDFMNDNVKPNSPLAHLNKSSKYYNNEKDEFYFNRSAAVFDAVLDFLATGSLHVPGNVCTEKFQNDLEFWGIPQSKLGRCCWKVFYRTEEDMGTLEMLMGYITSDTVQTHTNGSIQLPEPEADEHVNGCSRSYIYSALTNYSTRPAKVWYGILCVSIILSTFLFTTSTIPSFRVPVHTNKTYPYGNVTSQNAYMYWSTRPHPVTTALDSVCNVFFTVDWLVRFFCAPSKQSFMRSFLHCVELISFVFQWIGLWMELQRELFHVDWLYPILFVFSIIYCVRILRVFRLINHNVGVKILLLSLKSSARELFILALSFACVAIIFGLLLYLAESTIETDATPPNVLVSLWWAVVTMTTVGYGDYYPTTPLGCCIGCLCALTGILLIALPIAVTSSNFSDYYMFNKYRERYIQSLDQKEELDK